LTDTIQPGASMVIGQESIDIPAVGGETPSKNNEAQSPSSEPAYKAVIRDEEKKNAEFVSGSKKARVLGESRRKLAAMLISGAKENHTFRDNLKKQIEENPDLGKYFQKNWSKDYDMIFKDKTESEYEHEQATISEQAKAQARVEFLAEQLRVEKEEDALEKAEQLGFTSLEAKSLRDLALRLEGQKIGDEELDFEEALNRAAYTIRPDKSKVGITSLPSGIPTTTEDTKQVELSETHNRLADVTRAMRGAKKEDTMKNLEIVEKGLQGNVFQLPME